MELLELADKLFTGELPIEAHHPAEEKQTGLRGGPHVGADA